VSGVTVIVPAWNAERHLGEALESILGQDLAPDQVILVDDGSTDGTERTARAFAPRVTYVRQERGGATAARNRGAALARHPLHAHVDADDVLPPGSLRARVEALRADPTLEAASGHVQNFHSPELTDAERARIRCPADPVPSRVIASLVIRAEALEVVCTLVK
jgi:glycosyltransferase involved in cell wall biosynthesis